MIGHLGPRVSALLDGQLSPAETERAWSHVHQCHACRDLVEREGWIKARLAGLSAPQPSAPPHLVGVLAAGPLTPPRAEARNHRGWSGAAFLGGTAVGAVVVGVVALGVNPGATSIDRRSPVGQDGAGTSTSRPTPARSATSGSSQGPISAGANAPTISTRSVRAGIAGVKIGR